MINLDFKSKKTLKFNTIIDESKKYLDTPR